MLSALTTADRVVITFGPGTQGIEATLEATCRTQDDARVLASQLSSMTAMLKKNASDNEVAATLAAGSFDQRDRRVTGKWPLRKSLLDVLTNGL
jgi:UDP-N-acetylmuramate-alanine ligase